MRARLTVAIGTLLLLSAFGVPSSTAKTGDTECAGNEIWFNDAEDDAGYLLDGGTNVEVSGRMDLRTFITAEEEDDCSGISFTLSVSDGESTASPDAVTYKVDLLEPSDSDDDWTIEYTFAADEADESVVLKNGDTEVSNGTTSSGSGTQLTISVLKSTFTGTDLWEGVSATTSSLEGDASSLQDPTLTKDSASDDTHLIVDYGYDADEDGLPDSYEEDVFGDTETSDGNATTDTDGDGISDAQEYEDGTDPTDANDPAPPEEEEEEDPADNATYKDDDGEPGMTGNESLGEKESYAYTFDEPGNYTFEDGANPDNTITITVVPDTDGETETHVVNITDEGFDPETLTIEEGDTVVFVNEDAAAHSVQAADEGNGLDFTTFEAESEYATVAGAGAGAVIVLSLIALLARWKA